MSDKIKKYYETYNYTEKIPIEIDANNLSIEEYNRLTQSNNFCILPWLHLHAWPTGKVYPCCVATNSMPLGDLKEKTLAEIWNDDPMKQLRQNMLNDKPNLQCTRCYSDEKHGLFSMRNSSNKHFGHHISEVQQTNSNGTLDTFKVRYWDIRFSNICNFKCRYCGPNFSSSWWEDKAALYGKDSIGHEKFLHAGKDKEDMWDQMQAQLPYVEQIYFAGGEPLIMEEHYRLLKYLVENNRTDVRLIYNTNFSELRFKKQDVLEWWNKFESVSVGASLDAMGPRAEYMRKGTVWNEIELNRQRMMEVCPNVDFYISATINVFNLLHITDFHRDWVEKKFIQPQDININILNSPTYYRCDILPDKYKEIAKEKIEGTIQWLADKDHLTRATTGYKGLLNFIKKDNTSWIKEFFKITDMLDNLRVEKFDDVFPEYRGLRGYT